MNIINKYFSPVVFQSVYFYQDKKRITEIETQQSIHFDKEEKFFHTKLKVEKKEKVKIYFSENKQQNMQPIKRKEAGLEKGMPLFIDMGYRHLMKEREQRSLATQIHLIMIGIRKFKNPPAVHLCGVNGTVQEYLNKMNYQKWPLKSFKEDFKEIAKSQAYPLIYLSPDSSEPLAQVKEDHGYVLGGLVDRENIIKYTSLRRAEQLCIETRYLPIKHWMKNRHCLNLDHVVMVLQQFQRTKSWRQAFEFGVPKRWKKFEKTNSESQIP